MATNIPNVLIDKPSFLATNFKGYFHDTDPTMLPFNALTFPSVNCSIPDRDKIIPDLGKTLLGQVFTENIGINGNMEKFKNAGGLEMEVRTFPSADANLKDVIEIYFTNNRLLFSTLVGTFAEGATVVGATSNATGIIVSILGTVLTLSNITGTFIVGETITQSIPSVATAVVVSPPTSQWRQITENVNPLTRGVHEYYFDQWFDTNTSSSLSLNLPRLIWVNGLSSVFSWTGGVALITGVSATNITIDGSTTWRSLGFTEDASGNAYVIVNGVSYQLANTADLNTSTIDVTSTVGVSVGDYATAKIEVDATPIPFDMCRTNKNYMFYGNWESRDLYMSNAFNHVSTTIISAVQAVQNDLVISDTTNYTGTGSHIFHVTIDSVRPDTNTQTFTGTGANNAYFDTTAYSASGLNVYKVSVVADYAFTFVGAPALTPAPGDILTGSVSNAIGRVVFLDAGGQDPVLELLSGEGFVPGDVISGSQGTPYGTVATAVGQIWVQTFKNGLPFVPSGYVIFAGYQFLVGTQVNIIDGLDFVNGADATVGSLWQGANVGDFWELTISEGQSDTFQWSIDGGAPVATGVAITGGNQSLQDGVVISFVNINGHTLGDYWDIQADQEITRAWDNFYYTLPVRKPGEGYKYRLPSNFWTMDTQEESMYINSSYGEWSVVSTVLSGDLLSEDVSLTPLKQAGSNKVLYPYLTGHINNDLVYISVTKNLDFIGRQEFLEKPQIGYLSEPVRLDFEGSTFVGGRIKYLNKHLYISSPQDAIMHCYDTYKEYWQPPKSFPETAILSIVGNDLICHSNVRNQSFTMFSGVSDNDQGYTVTIRTPYTSVEDRWTQKFSSMSFTEGYIQGNPILTHTAYLGVNGCGGILPHTIDAIVCIAPDNAPIGEGALGNHALGSDVGIQGNYFQEIYKAYSPLLQYYFIALEISCTAKNHSYAILSLGMNGMYSSHGNNKLTNPNNLVVNNP